MLDTNIVSEVMKPSPSETVVDWLNQQQSERLHLSSVTIGEIEYGLRILPDGRRRRDLHDRFNRFVAVALRILSYDKEAARCHGEIMAARKALGRPMTMCLTDRSRRSPGQTAAPWPRTTLGISRNAASS